MSPLLGASDQTPNWDPCVLHSYSSALPQPLLCQDFGSSSSKAFLETPAYSCSFSWEHEWYLLLASLCPVLEFQTLCTAG